MFIFRSQVFWQVCGTYKVFGSLQRGPVPSTGLHGNPADDCGWNRLSKAEVSKKRQPPEGLAVSANRV